MDTVLTVILGLTLITGGGRTLTVRLATGFGGGTIAFTAIALCLAAASSFFALLSFGLVQLDGGNVLAGSPGFASEPR